MSELNKVDKGYRQFRDIVDPKGRMISTRLARAIVSLACKNLGIDPKKLNVESNRKKVSEFARELRKNPKAFEKIRNFVENDQLEDVLFKSELLRMIKNFQGDLILNYYKGGNEAFSKVDKATAAKAIQQFETSLRNKFDSVALVRFRVVYRGNKQLVINLKPA